MRNKINIAIDGPAGAGKSTIAKAIARELGIAYLDTGAMYRACGLKALNLGIDCFDAEQITQMIQDTSIDITYEGGVQKVWLDGTDVTSLIRTQEVSKAASDIGTNANVRKKLVHLQQTIAADKSVVMDGRDIAMYVLPNADFKFYVTASVEERAKRRYKDLYESNTLNGRSMDDLIIEIAARDYVDMNREAAPLRPADDAEIVDTSCLTADEAVEYILTKIMDKEEG